jgi:hypothetical protein
MHGEISAVRVTSNHFGSQNSLQLEEDEGLSVQLFVDHVQPGCPSWQLTLVEEAPGRGECTSADCLPRNNRNGSHQSPEVRDNKR